MAEERRLVTVLFADVTGSTALGEELDPEDVRRLLSRYYAIAKDVVALHGGTLEKFIGDAVMAIFGVPAAHGDDAARALSAAIDLRDRVRTDPALGERLPIRIGVNTGEVVAARSRDADFLVTGDAVNIAARLQQGADPWGILCSERTARAAGDGFEFGTALDLDAKGKRQPIRALPVLARSTSRAARVRMPMFGRDADLAQLELAAARALTERRPFLVSIIAPAGTGKSRLLEEFLDRLSTREAASQVAIAQCLPYGQRLTYWPLRAVLHRLAGLSEDAEPAAVRERLVEWLTERGVEDAAGTARLLAATVGAGDSEVPDRSALLAAWRNTVEAASAASPLVLVFEDLHWSSDSLLELVEFVMQPRGNAAVLMVALTRPELLERRPSWGGGKRNHLALSLEPLSDGAVASLVEHLLEAASPAIVARIVERADGNPFYAGELVRALTERIGPRPELAAIDEALLKLPDTVQATVLARLDLLGPDERRALQVGAVFGRSFRPAGLAALAPELAASAERLAEALTDRDLVRPFGADGYAFRHILIREVAYQTLPRSERAQLHAAAGAWLESRAAGREEAVAELIAFHYREAAVLARLLDPEAGSTADLSRAAVRWLRRAAETAAAGAASIEAERHLRSAIDLADRVDLADLYERLGVAQGGGDGAVASFKRALSLVRDLGGSVDQQLRVIAGLLATFMRYPGSLADSPSPAELDALRSEGAALVDRAHDERTVASYLIADAFLPFWLSHHGGSTSQPIAAAERSAHRGLAIAERLGDLALQSAALDALGASAMQRDAWRDVRDIGIRRLAMADRLDLTERIDTYAGSTWAGALLGELDEAARVSAAGLAQAQPGQVPAWMLHLAAWRAYALALTGAWDGALAAADRARELWVELGRGGRGYALRGLIAGLDVARARHDEPRTERYADAIEAITREYAPDQPHHRCRAFLGGCREVAVSGLVTLETARHRTEFAEQAIARCTDDGCMLDAAVLRTIIAAAAELGFAPLEAQARRALGLALGQADGAARELERAMAMFDAMGAIPYAARVRCELGSLVGDADQLAAGMRALGAIGDVEQIARYERRQRAMSRP
ncbi:MAG: AAA family ATPase [Actinobacteria bacterium]|nr:AAA family ATPase [Actinomycetota bacterium]